MEMQVVTITSRLDGLGEHITISCEKDNKYKNLAAVFSDIYSNGFYGCSYRPDGTLLESNHMQSFDDFVKEVFANDI